MSFDSIGETLLSSPNSPASIGHDEEEISSSKPTIDFQALIDHLSRSHSNRKLKDFISKAALVRLSIDEFEKYLNCLEKALIITKMDKFKQLFLHACAVGDELSAERYLQEAALDPHRLLLEVFSYEKLPIEAVQQLARNGIALQKNEATIPIVLLLFDAGVLPDQILIDGKPVLLWAIELRDTNFLTTICSKAPEVHPSYLTNATVIAFMTECNWIQSEQASSVAILRKFSELGASLEKHKVDFFTLAVSHDDISLARTLLALLQESEFQNGLTPLHIACGAAVGHDVIKLLLDEHADVDAQEEETNQRPLHKAIASGNVRSSTLLIEQGANIFLEDTKGLSPLQMMLLSSDPKMRALVLSPSLHKKTWPLEYWAPVLPHLKSAEAVTPEFTELLNILLPKYSALNLRTVASIELFVHLMRLECWNGAGLMLQKSFDLHFAVDNTTPSAFARLLANKMCKALSYLINEKQLDPNTKTASHVPLLFWAVEMKDDQLINALIQAKVDVNARGKDQETLLHFAVKKKDLKCVKWCLDQTMDVNLLDIHKRPALYYALTPIQPEVTTSLLKAGAKPFYLADRLIHYNIYILQGNRGDLVLDDSFKHFHFYKNNGSLNSIFTHIGQACPAEALEICFLLQSKIQPVMRWFSTKEQIIQQLLALRKKYPQAPIEYFYNFLASFSQEHLRRQVIEFVIPPVPAKIDVKILLTEFDKLNWTDPSKPCYCDPEGVKIMGELKKRETLRDSLKMVLETYLPLRQQFTGTPAAGTDELFVFYENLENVLKNIVLLIQEPTTDEKLRTKAILKFAWACILCGTRWEETATRVYMKLKHKRKDEDLLEHKYDEELYKLRENIIRNMANYSTHGYRQAVRHLGKEFNIAMREGIADVAEPGEIPSLTPQMCRYTMHYVYQPHLLIPYTHEFIKRCIKKNDGVIINWFQSHIPYDFTFAGHEALSYAITAIPLLYPDAKSQEVAIQQLFKQAEVYKPAEDSAEKGLKTYLAQEYTSTKVYDFDNGTVLMDGVIHFMLQRGVLQETHKNILIDFINAWNKAPLEKT